MFSWSPKPLVNTHQRMAFFDSCILELKTWLYDLPSELKMVRQSGPSRFPHAYTLSMVYHTAVILLCEPFLKGIKSAYPQTEKICPVSKDSEKSDEACQASMQKIIEKAYDTCSTSVRAMCFISQKYRKVFGSFKLSPITATHCTLSYAMIIIDRCCAVTPKPALGDETSPLVSPHHAVALCLQVLRELSTSWNIARRIGRNLERVYIERYGGDPLPWANQDCSQDCQSICACPPASADLSGLPTPLSPLGANFDAFLYPKDVALGWPSMFSIPNTLPIQNHGMYHRPITTDIHADPDGLMQPLPNSEELFANNLGFAFSPDCLPSDYNMFDTLNQMYLEETW